MSVIRRTSLYFLLLVILVVIHPFSAAQTWVKDVFTGTDPTALAVNPQTNKIYILNYEDGTVSVVDGSTNTLTGNPISVGDEPESVAVDLNYNKIYVTGWGDNNVVWIDGRTNTPHTINNIPNAYAVAVNQSTDKIYVTCNLGGSGSLAEIDGYNNLVSGIVSVRDGPEALAINPVTKRIYVANSSENTVSVIDVSTGQMRNVDTVLVGRHPYIVVVNPITNMIYVASDEDYTVSIIDGSNDHVTTINLGDDVTAEAMALNPATNMLYIGGSDDNVTMIQGSTNMGSVALEDYPLSMVADPVTNKIYIALGNHWLTMIDGATNTVYPEISIGSGAYVMAANFAIDRIYTANAYDNTISVIAGVDAAPLQFVSMPPCRLVDTRQPGGGGAITGHSSRDFYVPQLGGCGVPNDASAYSLNVTVTPHIPLGYLTIWPTGQEQPLVSTMNSRDHRNKANAAIIPAGYHGGVSVYVSDATDVILDINGYFETAGAQTYQFYPLAPCRVVDTRNAIGDLGGPRLEAGQQRDFPLRESTTCIPQGVTVRAYSLNFTAIPNPAPQPLHYLEVWPTGQEPANPVSTLNNMTATTVANAAIVPAGSGQYQDVSVYVSDSTDLAIDINGYFGNPSSSGLSLYPVAPCRVLDTRNGQPDYHETVVDVVDSTCAPPRGAKAYSFNATAIPTSSFHWLALLPDGPGQPAVSTLNARDGFVTSNMAIVPTSDGEIDAWTDGGTTNLILDLSAYFAPQPVFQSVPNGASASHAPGTHAPKRQRHHMEKK